MGNITPRLRKRFLKFHKKVFIFHFIFYPLFMLFITKSILFYDEDLLLFIQGLIVVLAIISLLITSIVPYYKLYYNKYEGYEGNLKDISILNIDENELC